MEDEKKKKKVNWLDSNKMKEFSDSFSGRKPKPKDESAKPSEDKNKKKKWYEGF